MSSAVTTPERQDRQDRARPTGRKLLGSIVPWLVGLAILVWLIRRVSSQELLRALDRGPALALAAIVVVHIVVSLLSDTFATRIGLSIVGLRRGYVELLWVRGTTYLIGLLNFTVGQGALFVFLSRTGVANRLAIGATVLQITLSGLALVVLCGLTVVFFDPLATELRWSLFAATLLGLAALAVLHRSAPGFLTRRSIGVLFSVSLADHARALISRALQFLVTALIYWFSLRVWGIEVSLAAGVTIVLFLLLLAMLPITPYGVGTVQVAQLALLSRYVDADVLAEREAAVLAFSAVQYAVAIVTQAAIGYLCWLKWRSLGTAEPIGSVERQHA